MLTRPQSSSLLGGAVCIALLGTAALATGGDVLPFKLWSSATDGESAAVELVHVIDGDTIIVDRDGEEERVRILGIDAPEVARNGEAGERCADEATALTEALTAGGTVELIADPSQSETDRYGRTLAYVEADGTDVGVELLAAGLAEVYGAAPDIARYDHYQNAAAQAEPAECGKR